MRRGQSRCKREKNGKRIEKHTQTDKRKKNRHTQIKEKLNIDTQTKEVTDKTYRSMPVLPKGRFVHYNPT